MVQGITYIHSMSCANSVLHTLEGYTCAQYARQNQNYNTHETGNQLALLTVLVRCRDTIVCVQTQHRASLAGRHSDTDILNIPTWKVQ